MNDVNIQEHLTYLTNEEVKNIGSPNLRGVTSIWENKIVKISFYYDGKITDADRDVASDACAYIISHFPDALLEENYIVLNYPKPLPTHFLAYMRDEKKCLG